MAPSGTALSPLPWLDRGGIAGILIVSALAAGLFLYRAGAMPLTDPDEGRYAEISRQMAIDGDWLVPQLFGQPYLEKPPLLYWSTATAFRAFGPSEIAARLTPAVAATLGVFLVGLFTRRYRSSSAGNLAAIVLASSAFYIVLARTVLVDMLFAVAISGTLFSFFAYREAAGTRLVPALLFWLFLALATLSKGPAALVICAVVIAVDALLEGSWAVLFTPRLVASAPLYLLIALPWFALVQHRYPGFLGFYLWKEHLHRAAGSEHAEPIYWFIPWVVGGLFPWTPFAAAAASRWWQVWRERSLEGRIVRFSVVWAASVFLLFSLARGKLATYVLPMFPPLAVLLCEFLDRMLRSQASGKAIERSFVVVGALLLLGAVGVAVTASIVPVDLPRAGLALVLLPCFCGGTAILLWRRAATWKPLSAVVLVSVLLYLGLAEAAPEISRWVTARPLIDLVSKQIGPKDSYALFGKYLPSAAFYLERPPLLIGTRPELRFGRSLVATQTNIVVDLHELAERTAGGRLYVFTDNRPKRERELRAALGDVRLVARNYVAAVWMRP